MANERDTSTNTQAPIARDDFLLVQEGSKYTITLKDLFGSDGTGSANDYDTDSAAFTTITIASLVRNGTLKLNDQIVNIRQAISIADIQAGKLVFTPDDKFSGQANFKYRVSDGSMSSESATVHITVTPKNDAPVAHDDVIAGQAGISQTLRVEQLLGNDTDPDHDALVIINVTTLPDSGTLKLDGQAVTANQNIAVRDIMAGKLTFTPVKAGDASFKYKVSDGEFTSNEAAVTIRAGAAVEAPVAKDDEFTTREDTRIDIKTSDLLGNDNKNNASSLTIAALPNNGQLKLNGREVEVGQTIDFNEIDAGRLIFIPKADFNGDTRFQYLLNDGNRSSGLATATIHITAVNDAPIAINDLLLTGVNTTRIISADDLFDKKGILGFRDDYDPDNDPLASITITGLSNNGALKLNGVAVTQNQVISMADLQAGKLSFTPDAGYTGSARFYYTVSDGTISSNEASVTVRIMDAPRNPFSADDLINGKEDTTLTVSSSDLFGSDGNGAINDYGPASFTSITIKALSTDGLLKLSGNAVSVGQNISVADLEAGKLTFTPNAEFSGRATFQYAVNSGTASSGTATVTLAIAAVNDAPVAVADNLQGQANSKLIISSNDLFGSDGTGKINDYDIDSSEFASITITELSNSGTLKLGETAISANQVISLADIKAGKLSFTPNSNFSGDTAFKYYVSDGLLSSGIVSANINIAPSTSQGVPVAVNDLMTVAEDTALTVTSALLFGSDGTGSINDYDTNSAQFHHIVITQLASSGVLKLNGNAVTLNQQISVDDIQAGKLVFTPNADFNGNVTFQYKVADETQTSNTATATITVTPVNDAPIAVNDQLVYQSGTLIIKAADLLDNDSDVDLVSADAVTITITALPSNGTLQLNGVNVTANQVITLADLVANKLTYTGNSGFTGANFKYTVSDGQLSSEAATVSISTTVNKAPPVAVDDNLTVAEDTILTITAAQLFGSDGTGNQNDYDTDSTQFGGIAIAALASNGVLKLDGVDIKVNDVITLDKINAGKLTFTPNADFNGAANFKYAAFDESSKVSNIANANIAVAPVNDAPVANNDTLSATGSSMVIKAADILGNDKDIDNANFASISITTLPSNGTLKLNGVAVSAGQIITLADLSADKLSFTPNTGVNNANFKYTVSDGSLSSNEATVNLNFSSSGTKAPVAVDDVIYARENNVRVITADLLFGSDGTGQNNDYDNDSSKFNSITISALSSNGSLKLNNVAVTQNQVISLADIEAGKLTFTPNSGFVGNAEFKYQASDGSKLSNEAKVSLIVEDLPDAASSRIKLAAIGEISEEMSLSQIRTVGSNGEYVVSWYAKEKDGDYSTFIQKFNADGSTTGQKPIKLELNSNTSANEAGADITSLSNGDYIINSVSMVGQQGMAYLQKINANGSAVQIKLGELSQSNDSTFWNTSIARGEQGEFTAIWAGKSVTGNISLFAQQFKADGASNGALKNLGSSEGDYSVIANGNSGAFTLADISAGKLVLHRYDANFNELSNSTVQTGSITIPKMVNVGSNGDYVLYWQGKTGNEGLFLQKFKADGTSIGSVNKLAVAAYMPTVTASGDNGEYLVSWTSQTQDQKVLTFVQKFKADGTAAFDAPIVVTPADYIGVHSQTISLGNSGEFMVATTLYTQDEKQSYVMVQKFHANGDTKGYAPLIYENSTNAELVLLGNSGKIALTWNGVDDAGKVGVFSQQFSVAAASTSKTPPVAVDDNLTVAEDTTLTITAAQLFGSDGTGNQNDYDTDSAQFGGIAITTLVSNGTLKLDGVAVKANDIVTLAQLNAGKLTFTPNANFNGNANFKYVAVDDTSVISTQATVNINVTPVNDAPVANDDVINGSGGNILIRAADLVGNDRADTAGFTSVTISSLPSNGTLKLNGVAVSANQVISAADLTADKLSFAPNSGFNGNAVFKYILTDTAGTNSNEASVTLKVGNVTNTKPIAVDDNLTVAEDTALTITPAQLFGSDGTGSQNDYDTDSSKFGGIAITGLASNGTLKFNGTAVTANQIIALADLEAGKLTFTPNANFNGNANFKYIPFDESSLIGNEASVTIAVTPVNDAPVAVADSVAVSKTNETVIKTADLLGNDTDVDNSSFVGITIKSLTSQGTLKLNGQAVSADQVISLADLNAGKLTFSANSSAGNSDTFKYTVSDGLSSSNEVAVTLNISGSTSNAKPIAKDDNLTTNKNGSLTITPEQLFGADGTGANNDYDTDSAKFGGIAITSAPSNGTLKLNGKDVKINEDLILLADLEAGKLVFTPNAGFTGNASFKYVVFDQSAISDAATVTIAVNDANIPPVAKDDIITGKENTKLVISINQLLGNDTDTDNFTNVTITALSAHGTLKLDNTAVTANQVISVTDIQAGKLSFTGNNGFTGDTNFKYKVSDGKDWSNEANVTVKLSAIPESEKNIVQLESSPTGADEHARIASIGSKGEYAVVWQGKDSDGDSSIFVQKFNADGSISNNNVIKLETAANLNDTRPDITRLGTKGEFIVSWNVTGSDGQNHFYGQKFNADGSKANQDSFTLDHSGNLANGLDTPTFAPLGNTGGFIASWVAEGLIIIKTFKADGTSQSQTLSMVFTSEPELVSLGDDGKFALIAAQENGVLVRTMRATGEFIGHEIIQGKNISNTHLAATNNQGDFVAVWTEQQSSTNSSIHVQKFNADGSKTGNNHVVLDGASTLERGNYIDTAPQVARIGNAGEFVVVWQGGDSRDAGYDYSVYVQKFKADGSKASDTPTRLEASGYTSGDDIAPQVTALGNNGEFVVSWQGKNSDGQNNIYVQKFNAAGVAQAVVQLHAPGVTDGDNYAPQITAVGNNGNYAVTWYGKDDNGDNSVFVRQFNGDGSTVTPVPPVANNDTLSTAVNTALTITTAQLLGNDSDADSSSFTSIKIVAFDSNGTLKLDGNAVIPDLVISIADLNAGKLSFVPNTGFSGKFHFIYSVSDGTFSSNQAEVTIGVNASATAKPVAVDDTLTSNEDTNLTITPALLFGSDGTGKTNDFDDDSAQFAHIVVASLPTQGTLKLDNTVVSVSQTISLADLNAGKLVFVPSANFNGNTSFQYSVSDGVNTSNVATATIQITAQNDAPVAVSDTLATAGNTPLTITPTHLFGDDATGKNNDLDIDNNAFANITISALANNGTLKLNGNVVTANQVITLADLSAGKLSFVPNDGFSGNATFKYTVSDGALNSNEATVTIAVSAPAVALPVAVDDTLTTNEDTNLTITPALLFGSDGTGKTNDFDDDSAQFAHIVVASLPTQGTLKLDNTVVSVSQTISLADLNAGKLAFEPAKDFNGNASFQYKVSDGVNTSDVAKVTIQVAAVNDKPEAVADTLSGKENTLLTITPAHLFGDDGTGKTNDFDIDNSEFASITITALAANGTLKLNNIAVTEKQNISVADLQAGKLTFMPTTGFSGAASFKYYVSDGLLSSGEVSATINIAASNDAPVAVDDHLAVNSNHDLTISASSLFGVDGAGRSNDYDVDSASFSGITITALPSNGTLKLSGSNVTANQTISLADLNAGKLVFTPNANYTGHASFKYQVSDGETSSNVATVHIDVVETAAARVKLDADDNAAGVDVQAKLTAIGDKGEYVAVWMGQDSGKDATVYVQKFNADGTKSSDKPVKIEVDDGTYSEAYPTVNALGNGEFVVSWGVLFQFDKDTTGEIYYMQKFDSSGKQVGDAVILDEISKTALITQSPSIAAIGNKGEYVATWSAYDEKTNLSVYVQKFDSNGKPVGTAPARLDQAGKDADMSPSIAAVGNSGEFVVSWTKNGNDIVVQKFNANGTTSGQAVELAGAAKGDYIPQIDAIGNQGDYVVTWFGAESDSNYSVFVQKFNANGSKVGQTITLESNIVPAGADMSPQTVALGNNGEFVVSWVGQNSATDTSLFLQRFNADGSKASSQPIQLDALNGAKSLDSAPSIAAIGSNGEFALTWTFFVKQPQKETLESFIMVQKFNADGTSTDHAPVYLKAGDFQPSEGYSRQAAQITAVGKNGAFVVSWEELNSNTDSSIYVQKFNADGTLGVTNKPDNSFTHNADTISGHTADHTLVGGLGADTFTWKLSDTPVGTTTDQILDFSQDEKIDLSDLVSHGAKVEIDNSKHTVKAEYTDASGIHTQLIHIEFDRGVLGSHDLKNMGDGIIKLG